MADVDIFSFRFGSAKRRMPPLGPLCLSGALRAAGLSATIFDAQDDPEIGPFSSTAVANRLMASTAPAIAISIFNDAIPALIAAMDHIGTRLRDRRIWLGGPGVVGAAELLMRRIPQLEAVVVGEGETALPLLVSDFSSARQLSGVFTRDANGEIVGSGRTPREDLNRLASPDWEWSRDRHYEVVPLATMRGCPFDCQFCEVVAFLGRRVTASDVDRAIDQLETAVDCMGTRQVALVDDTFTVNRRRVLDFCRRIAERNVGIRFSLFSRVDTIDQEVMEALATAGCERVFFGVDAGDDETLKHIAKGIRVSDAVAKAREAANYFAVTASFIWGYPCESLDAVRRTVEVAQALDASRLPFPIISQLHLLSPWRGTPLFDKYGTALVLDKQARLLTLNERTVDYSTRADYACVNSVIENEVDLAAAYYRYATDSFEEKKLLVESFYRQRELFVGRVARSANDTLQGETHVERPETRHNVDYRQTHGARRGLEPVSSGT